MSIKLSRQLGIPSLVSFSDNTRAKQPEVASLVQALHSPLQKYHGPIVLNLR